MQFLNPATYYLLLGAFAKLRKATSGFVMSVRQSVCPSVRMEQIFSHWTDFHVIWCLSIKKNCR